METKVLLRNVNFHDLKGRNTSLNLLTGMKIRFKSTFNSTELLTCKHKDQLAISVDDKNT